jgi:hypothetical protein
VGCLPKRDRFEIVHNIVLELIGRAIEDMRLPMADAYHVAIRCRSRDPTHADAAARTGDVFDDHGLTERCPHVFGEDARERIRGAARWVRYDYGDGARWIRLPACDPCEGWKSGSA